MNWIEIKASFQQAPEDASPAIDVFLEHGCENTQQQDKPFALLGCLVDVPGTDEIVDNLKTALLKVGADEVNVRTYPEEDWLESWKLQFKPQHIGKHFVICPTWETYEPQPGDRVINIDPGQAFGTGDHATTRCCLEILEETDLKDLQIADVGCGSGILSIAAKMLGAAQVSGVDIEPTSVEVSKANARLNDVQIEFVHGNSISALGEGPWDIVISNIISATLIRMASEIASSFKPGGLWIVSGIVEMNWPDVQAAAKRAGFELEKQRQLDDWVSAIFKRLK